MAAEYRGIFLASLARQQPQAERSIDGYPSSSAGGEEGEPRDSLGFKRHRARAQ